MDISNIKKYADSNYDIYKISKGITELKNEVKNKEKGTDMLRSEYFRTLREPLLEQQKKTDEKQDKVIEQLTENQLALTDSFQKMIETSKERSLLPRITSKSPTLEKPEVKFSPISSPETFVYATASPEETSPLTSKEETPSTSKEKKNY